MRFQSTLLAIPVLSISAWSQSFTLEQALSSPFPSDLVAAKQGSRVAWLFDARGERNIWVADGPNFAATARPITHYTGDDGQPIAALRLTPDAQTVVYARGSEVNEQGKSADPEHDVSPPKQQVWAKDVEGGAPPRLLGDMGCAQEGCEDIEVSPDGKWVTWVASNKLLLTSIDGKETAKELVLIRGSAREPRWSPDSRTVAFVSERGDHSLIGLWDPKSQIVRYIAPSFDKDDLPRWSTDGKWVTYVKTAGEEQKEPLIPVRTTAWSIWVADARTLAGRELWRSGARPRDSLPELSEDGSLYFAGDYVVFSSEQEGWNHLYSVRITAGNPVLLTPGEFEVEDVTLSPDQKWVIYTSNQNDSDRRHIWQVPVAGGQAPQPLTSGDTIEWAPVSTGDGKAIVCLGSTATTPAMPYVLRKSGREMLAPDALPKDFPSAQLITPEQVIFKSEDGITLHGQLFAPRAAKGNKVPALVFMHGGPYRQMLLGFHYMDYYHNAYAMNEYLASHGYEVLSVNYRLGIMYGRDFREAPNTIWRGAAEYKDIVAAGRYLKSQPQVDPQRIGLWGGSYGGFLAAMGLAKNSDIFSAGVDFHGVHDWTVFLTQRPYFGNLSLRPPDVDAAVKLAWDSSPDAYVGTWRSPVLLIQGDDDRNVPVEQSVDLAQRLRYNHVPFEQLLLPDEIHDFLMWRTWIRVYGATADFFDRTLKQRQEIGEGVRSSF
ncbi:MAG: S9 family peptidase [Acidobacteria bacterium]|nr:S9 family peptidase [Acidobacteriota bacterium]